MSATQRARSGVPLDKRSLVVTVPGLPWWGVILLATGVTAVGVLIDATGGSGELTSVFSTFYFLGVLFAVVAASNKALFTAMAQPPLILFAAVPIAHTLIGKDKSTALRDIAINIAYPLVNRFPVMLAATVVVLVIGGVRYFLLIQRPNGVPRSVRTRRSTARPVGDDTRRGGGSRRRRAAVDDRTESTPPIPEPIPSRSTGPTVRRPYRAEAPPAPRYDGPRSAPAPRRVAGSQVPYDPPAPPPRRAAPSLPPLDGERPAPRAANRPRYAAPETGNSGAERRPTAGQTSDYPSYGRRRPAERESRPSTERMDPYFDADEKPSPLRRRPPGAQAPAYPPPRVRYRDRDEPRGD
ncbi:hypothetical protein ABH922_000879 [Rhodococcus sp. 27YEA15]|uniref:DUF6542 domain-containing protein n=1 Tax=Rhodococcus sp. 27YEA15 TaxID=3156259 RepID=UPI003C7CEB87